MKVALAGHGQMGREVDAVLRDRGHSPVGMLRGTGFPAGCPVGIDFTGADAVVPNVKRALAAGARYVVGTTGWDAQRDEVRRLVEDAGGGLVYGSNFSVGMNLFYQIVRQTAALMARFGDYDPYVLERHHRKKKDAPSGTARVLASIVAESGGPRGEAVTSLGPDALGAGQFGVASVRAGGIVGDHTVGFDSGGDEILLEHRARSRRGFALGAVLAAEWIVTRTGFHSFDAVLEDLQKRQD
jgi:4-hydroxy-tetrahydrodipicolinate reductase